MNNIELANQLINTTTISIDTILANFKLTQEEYRKVYPDTPITPSLALDILEAKEYMTNKQIKRRWSLSNSQLNYALYNDNAIKNKNNDYMLPRTRIIQELKKTNKSQTQIAEEYNVSQSLVHKIAKEQGLLPTNRKKRKILTKEQKDNIKDAVEDGIAVEDLAKQYGVSRDTIYKYLRSI